MTIELGPWIKSTHSKKQWDDFECVETRRVTVDGALAVMQVRDSKDSLGPVLSVARRAWQAFVAAPPGC